MRAVVGRELGPAEHYDLVEIPRPEPKHGEVCVKVHAVGVGYVDALVAAGRYQVRPPTPFPPGMEFSGTIERLGAGVESCSVGDAVMTNAMGGGMAEFVVVGANAISPIPTGLSFEQAAGFRTNYMTAYHALVDRASLRKGDAVLVLGASGGVGAAAVDVANALGAHVIAACSTKAKRDFALSHGARQVIDYTDANWRDELKKLTAGVDIVFDPVGGEFLEPAFRSLKWKGRHLVIGFAGGPIPALRANLALLKGGALVGVDIRQFLALEPDRAKANDKALCGLIAQHLINPAVGRVFAFESFREALTYALAREGVGKTVLRVLGDSVADR
jgi:NADPH2:quinone reductase